MAEWNDALDQCETILNLIDEDVPEWAWDKSPDFFEKIQERVRSMSDWIEDHEHVTEKMADALDNMEAGVRKWIKE